MILSMSAVNPPKVGGRGTGDHSAVQATTSVTAVNAASGRGSFTPNLMTCPWIFLTLGPGDEGAR